MSNDLTPRQVLDYVSASTGRNELSHIYIEVEFTAGTKGIADVFTSTLADALGVERELKSKDGEDYYHVANDRAWVDVGWER